jgi:hypothetical protein
MKKLFVDISEVMVSEVILTYMKNVFSDLKYSEDEASKILQLPCYTKDLERVLWLTLYKIEKTHISEEKIKRTYFTQNASKDSYFSALRISGLEIETIKLLIESCKEENVSVMQIFNYPEVDHILKVKKLVDYESIRESRNRLEECLQRKSKI